MGSPHPKLACSALPTINNILCGSGVGTHQPEGAIIPHRRHCYIWLQNQSPVWEWTFICPHAQHPRLIPPLYPPLAPNRRLVASSQRVLWKRTSAALSLL